MPKTSTTPSPATAAENGAVDRTGAPTRGTAAINVHLGVDLHRRLKVRAAERGLTVKAAVTEAIEAWTA